MSARGEKGGQQWEHGIEMGRGESEGISKRGQMGGVMRGIRSADKGQLETIPLGRSTICSSCPLLPIHRFCPWNSHWNLSLYQQVLWFCETAKTPRASDPGCT